MFILDKLSNPENLSFAKDMPQFLGPTNHEICRVGVHKDRQYMQDFFESAVKEWDGKSLPLYEGHADSPRFQFLPEQIPVGYANELSFDGEVLRAGKIFFTNPTIKNNFDAGMELGFSIRAPPRDGFTMQDTLDNGVSAENSLLKSLAVTMTPAVKSTVIKEEMECSEMSEDELAEDIINTPPWGDISKTSDNFEKGDFLIHDGENFSEWKFPYKYHGKIHAGGVIAAFQMASKAKPALTSEQMAKLERLHNRVVKWKESKSEMSEDMECHTMENETKSEEKTTVENTEQDVLSTETPATVPTEDKTENTELMAKKEDMPVEEPKAEPEVEIEMMPKKEFEEMKSSLEAELSKMKEELACAKKNLDEMVASQKKEKMMGVMKQLRQLKGDLSEDDSAKYEAMGYDTLSLLVTELSTVKPTEVPAPVVEKKTETVKFGHGGVAQRQTTQEMTDEQRKSARRRIYG